MTRLVEVNGVVVELAPAQGAVDLVSRGDNYLVLRRGNRVVKTYFARNEHCLWTSAHGRNFRIRDRLDDLSQSTGPAQSVERNLTAPMPGTIIRVLSSPGDTVKAGQVLVIVEAMKMENEVRATADAVVERVLVSPGQQVGFGEVLVEVKPVGE